MADFKDASLWMKLAMLLVVLGYCHFMFAMDTPGWSSTGGYNCGKGGCSRPGWVVGIEACMVIGYLCGLTAVTLSLCLVVLDEVKGNKIARICFIIFAIVAGFLWIVGVAIFGGKVKHGGEYCTMITVLGGIQAIIAGVFGILDLVGVGGGK